MQVEGIQDEVRCRRFAVSAPLLRLVPRYLWADECEGLGPDPLESFEGVCEILP